MDAQAHANEQYFNLPSSAFGLCLALVVGKYKPDGGIDADTIAVGSGTSSLLAASGGTMPNGAKGYWVNGDAHLDYEDADAKPRMLTPGGWTYAIQKGDCPGVPGAPSVHYIEGTQLASMTSPFAPYNAYFPIGVAYSVGDFTVECGKGPLMIPATITVKN